MPTNTDLFQLIVEASPNAIIVIDHEQAIKLVNRSAEELFGYHADELVGQPIGTLLPDRHKAAHSGLVRSFLAAPLRRPMGEGRDLLARQKCGTEIPVEIGLNPIRTPGGDLTLAMVTDIRERRRAQAAQDRLAAIVESSDDAIISKSLDGVVTGWNDGANRLLAIRPSRRLASRSSC